MQKYASKPNIQYLLNWIKTHLAKKSDLDTKVDKAPNMGLSHNDLTDELLTKINNAGNSSFTGDYNDLTNKPDIAATAITAVEGSGIGTDLKTIKETYVSQTNVNTMITQAVATAGHVHFERADSVDALPKDGDPTAIYYVPDPKATTNNAYIEYFWDSESNKWEPVGSCDYDFNTLWKKDELEALTNEELETMINAEVTNQ